MDNKNKKNIVHFHKRTLTIILSSVIFTVISAIVTCSSIIPLVRAGLPQGDTLSGIYSDVRLSTFVYYDDGSGTYPNGQTLLNSNAGTQSNMGNDPNTVTPSPDPLVQGQQFRISPRLYQINIPDDVVYDIYGKGTFYSSNGTLDHEDYEHLVSPVDCQPTEPGDVVMINPDPNNAYGCAADVPSEGEALSFTFYRRGYTGSNENIWFNFDFMHSEELPPDNEFFLRLDYVAVEHVASLYTIPSYYAEPTIGDYPIIENGDINNAGNQGYMNFKFTLNPYNDPPPKAFLIAGQNETGYTDIDPRYPDAPLPIDAGFLPPTDSSSMADNYYYGGVITDPILNLDVRGLAAIDIDGDDILDHPINPPDNSPFRDDLGVLIYSCSYTGETTTNCDYSPVLNGIEQPVGTLPVFTDFPIQLNTTDSTNLTIGTQPFSIMQLFDNSNGPLSIDLDEEGIAPGEIHAFLLYPVDYRGQVSEYPIIYRFRRALPPKLDLSLFEHQLESGPVTFQLDDPALYQYYGSLPIEIKNLETTHTFTTGGCTIVFAPSKTLTISETDSSTDSRFLCDSVFQRTFLGDNSANISISDSAYPNLTTDITLSIYDSPELVKVFAELFDPIADPYSNAQEIASLAQSTARVEALEGDSVYISPIFHVNPDVSFIHIAHTSNIPKPTIELGGNGQLFGNGSVGNEYYFNLTVPPLPSSPTDADYVKIYTFNNQMLPATGTIELPPSIEPQNPWKPTLPYMGSDLDIFKNRLSSLHASYTTMSSACKGTDNPNYSFDATIWPLKNFNAFYALLNNRNTQAEELFGCIIKTHDDLGAPEKFWDGYVKIDIDPANLDPVISDVLNINQISLSNKDTITCNAPLEPPAETTKTLGAIAYQFTIDNTDSTPLGIYRKYEDIHQSLIEEPFLYSFAFTNDDTYTYCDERELGIDNSGNLFNANQDIPMALRIGSNDSWESPSSSPFIDYQAPSLTDPPSASSVTVTENSMSYTFTLTDGNSSGKVQYKYILEDTGNADFSEGDVLNYEALSPGPSIEETLTNIAPLVPGTEYALTLWARDEFDNKIGPYTYTFTTEDATLLEIRAYADNIYNPAETTSFDNFLGDTTTSPPTGPDNTLNGDKGDIVYVDLYGLYSNDGDDWANASNLIGERGYNNKDYFTLESSCNYVTIYDVDTSGNSLKLSLDQVSNCADWVLKVAPEPSITGHTMATIPFTINVQPAELINLYVNHDGTDYSDNGNSTIGLTWDSDAEYTFALTGQFNDAPEASPSPLYDEPGTTDHGEITDAAGEQITGDLVPISIDPSNAEGGTLSVDTSGEFADITYTFGANPENYVETWKVCFEQRNHDPAVLQCTTILINVTLSPPNQLLLVDRAKLDYDYNPDNPVEITDDNLIITLNEYSVDTPYPVTADNRFYVFADWDNDSQVDMNEYLGDSQFTLESGSSSIGLSEDHSSPGFNVTVPCPNTSGYFDVLYNGSVDLTFRLYIEREFGDTGIPIPSFIPNHSTRRVKYPNPDSNPLNTIEVDSFIPSNPSCPVEGSVQYSLNGTNYTGTGPDATTGIFTGTLDVPNPGGDTDTTQTVEVRASVDGGVTFSEPNSFTLEIDGTKPAVQANTLTYNNNVPLTNNADIWGNFNKITGYIDNNFTGTKSGVHYTVTVTKSGGPSYIKQGITNSEGKFIWSVSTPLPGGDYYVKVALEDTAGNTNENASTPLRQFHIEIDSSLYQVVDFSASPASPSQYDSLNNGVAFDINLSGTDIQRVALYKFDTDTPDDYASEKFTPDTNLNSDGSIKTIDNWTQMGIFTGSQGRITLSNTDFVDPPDNSYSVAYYALAVIAGAPGETPTVFSVPVPAMQETIMNSISGGVPGENIWPYVYVVDDRPIAEPKLTDISGESLVDENGVTFQGETFETKVSITEPIHSLTPRFEGIFTRDGSQSNVPFGSKIHLTVVECTATSGSTCETGATSAEAEFLPYLNAEGYSVFDWNYTLSNTVYPLDEGNYMATMSAESQNGAQSGDKTYYFNLTGSESNPDDIPKYREYPDDICEKLADGSDSCELSVAIRDQYGNYIDGSLRDMRGDPIAYDLESPNAPFAFDFYFPVTVNSASGEKENLFNVYVDYTDDNAETKESSLFTEPIIDADTGTNFDTTTGAFKYKIVSIAPSVDVRKFINTIGGRIINPDLGAPTFRDLDIKVRVKVDSEDISPSRNTGYFFDAKGLENDISEGNELTFKNYFYDTDSGVAKINCSDFDKTIGDLGFTDNDGNGVEDKYELCLSLKDMGAGIEEHKYDERFRDDVPVVIEENQSDTGLSGALIFSPFKQYLDSLEYDLIPAVLFNPAIEVEISHLVYIDGEWVPETTQNNTVTINKQAQSERFMLALRNKSDSTVFFGDTDLGPETIAQFLEDTASFEHIELLDDTVKMADWEYHPNNDQSLPGYYTYTNGSSLSGYVAEQGTERLALRNISDGLAPGKAIVAQFTADLGFNQDVLEAKGFFNTDLALQIASPRFFSKHIVYPGIMLGVNLINTALSIDLPGYAATSTDENSEGYNESEIYADIRKQFARFRKSETKGDTAWSGGDGPVDLVKKGVIDFDQFSTPSENVYTSNNGTVLYVENLNVRIKSDDIAQDYVLAPSGLHTLLISGGNLIIDSNIMSDTDTRGFGIMVVPKQYHSESGASAIIPPDQWLETDNNEFIPGGNVLVNPRVTDIHAHFFIQGALLNLDTTGGTGEGEFLPDTDLQATSSLADILLQEDGALPVVTEPVPQLRDQLYMEGVLVALQNTMQGVQNQKPFAEIEGANELNKLLDFSLFRIFSVVDNMPREFETNEGGGVTSKYSQYCKDAGVEAGNIPPIEADNACARAVIIKRGIFEAPPAFKELPRIDWSDVTGIGGDLQ